MGSEAYLGVERSLGGRRWVGPDATRQRLTEALAQETGLSEALCGVLSARGVRAPDVTGYLAPTLRDLMPDPLRLRDMEAATTRLIEAATRGERVAIFADYDVDGAASAALLIDWLRDLGCAPSLYVPDRMLEGYGPNPAAMRQLADAHDLIICVDCGTMAHDAIAAAEGCDVVVIDHHLGAETLPPALAVVNPNRQDESGDLGHLCAAAVVFLVLVHANRRLREEGRTGPDLMGALDLVALATVADVAPLTGVNRAFVATGLKIMAQRGRPGLAALADIGRLKSKPAAYHLGFVLGPRINAGGRVGRADLGARCLSTRDPHEAQALAERLDAFNTDRREIEAGVRDAALAQIEARGMPGALAWAAGEGWHPGVVGIAAARLKEATRRPAVVIGFDGDLGHGSGRSVTGVDLGHAVQKLVAEGLLEKGGGHRMAAGLTVRRDRLDAAMARLEELLARQGAGAGDGDALRLDGVLMPGAATLELVEQLEAAGPYGQASPAPRFVLPDVMVLHARRVGTGHLKVTLGDGLGARLDAISFGAFDGPIGPAVEGHGGRRFHVAGHLEMNDWQGRMTVQMRIDDVAEA